MMRIGLITTLKTNIGDDFIREGICLILQEVLKKDDIEFVSVNKHQPLTVYPNWHPIHLKKITRYLPKGQFFANRLLQQFAPKLTLSRFDSCNLIVQCGAPVLWPGCHRCDWAEPLWHQVVGRLSQRIPVFNLAAGSCYPWERQPSHIDNSDDEQYLKTILAYCRLTTVRDTLAEQLCRSLGTETPMIPCSALLAARNHMCTAERNNGVVLINFMHGGGHYEWNQGIDPSVWHATVKTLMGRLKKRHRLAFLCHNEAEYQLAQHLDPTLPRLWPKTSHEYFAMVSEARVALCNRMHASIVLAGLGIPSVAVCTDTRLLMVDAIELPCFYVKEVSVDQLEGEIEDLLAHHRQEQERLFALKTETWNRYVRTVAEALQ